MAVRAAVLAGAARLPEAVERAGTLFGGHARTLVAHPQLDPGAAIGGGDPDRAALGRDLERVVQQVVDHLLEPSGRRTRDGCTVDVGVDAHVLLGRERVPRVAPAVDARRRPRSGAGDDGDCSARASTSSPSTSRESRATSSSAPSRSSAAAPCTSASRFSSRSRIAASGVRSWCDASATNAALRADELLEPRRGRVERLGQHGELGGALRHLRARGEVARAERVRPRPRGRRAAWSPNARAAGWRGTRCRARRRRSPRAATRCGGSGRRSPTPGYVMRTAPWMPSTEPTGSATYRRSVPSVCDERVPLTSAPCNARCRSRGGWRSRARSGWRRRSRRRCDRRRRR